MPDHPDFWVTRFLGDRCLNGTNPGSNCQGAAEGGSGPHLPCRAQGQPLQPDQTLLMAFVGLPSSPDRPPLGKKQTGGRTESWGRRGMPGGVWGLGKECKEMVPGGTCSQRLCIGPLLCIIPLASSRRMQASLQMACPSLPPES